MKIESNVAAQLYDATKKLGLDMAPDPEQGSSFAEALETALRDMNSTLDRGEKASVDAMSGKGDTQAVVEALSASEMALLTTVTVRDKVVEAYQEILRMPV